MKLDAESQGQRLDHAIHAALVRAGRTVSIAEVREAIRDRRIRVLGGKQAAGARVLGGEEIDLSRFVPRDEAVIEPDPELLARAPVLHEDERILALSKPSGVPCHPLQAGERGTLLHAAVAQARAIAQAGPPLEGGLVHRLDGETSGVVVFAKTTAVRTSLREAFSAHEIEKGYWALVLDRAAALDRRGRIVVDAPLGPGTTPERMRVVDDDHPRALAARTEVRVRTVLAEGHLIVEARTWTGRRHQVRVHLAHLGAPIAGDRLYGEPSPHVPRLALHAAELVLPDGRRIVAPLPADLSHAVEHLGG